MRLVLVGNGNVQRDLSSTIGAADCVIRFNATPNYDKNTGTKVDVLCLSPGAVRRTTRAGGVGLEPVVAERASQIWLVPGMWPRLMVVTLLDAHGLRAKPTLELPVDLERSLLSRMRAASGTPLGRPMKPISPKSRFAHRQDSAGNICIASTGILAIEYVLSVPLFSQHEKCIVGFDWFDAGATAPGPLVHAWEAEKRICEGYIAAGRIKCL